MGGSTRKSDLLEAFHERCIHASFSGGGSGALPFLRKNRIWDWRTCDFPLSLIEGLTCTFAFFLVDLLSCSLHNDITKQESPANADKPARLKGCKNCSKVDVFRFISPNSISPNFKLPMHSFTRYVQSGSRPILLYTV